MHKRASDNSNIATNSRTPPIILPPITIPRDPRWWGPDTWSCMYKIVAGAPSGPLTRAERKRLQTFFGAISAVMPCSICRLNFKLEARAAATHWPSGAHCFAWLYGLHVRVRARTAMLHSSDPPPPLPPLREMMATYYCPPTAHPWKKSALDLQRAKSVGANVWLVGEIIALYLALGAIATVLGVQLSKKVGGGHNRSL